MGERWKMILKVTMTLLAASAGFIYYQNSVEPEVGVQDGRLKPLKKSPNGVSTQAEKPSKRVETLPFKDSSEDTMEALKTAATRYGGVVFKEETEDYLYLVFSTPTLGFRDDAEFWLDREAREVHFRSQARAGYSDRGMNRRRYNKLRELYLSAP